MSLAQSDILTSRFAFQTHAPEEFCKGIVDRLPERVFRTGPGDATIDVSGVRGDKRTPDWLTCSPVTWTEQHLEPHLLTALRSAGSWNSTENTWIMNLLPDHEPVLIKPLVPDSVLPGDWSLVLGVCASTAVLVWPVIEVSRINENNIFEPLADDSAGAMLKFLSNVEWLAWPCEWGSPLQQRAVHGATTVQAGFRLVTGSPAEPLAAAAARCAFWSAGERVLRKLVKHLELGEL